MSRTNAPLHLVILNSLTDITSSYHGRDVEHNSHSGHLHNGHDSKPLSLLPHHINNDNVISNGGPILPNHQIKHDNNTTAGNELDPSASNLDSLGGQR